VLHRIYGLPELSDAQVQAVLTVLDRVGARAYADGLTAEAHERALAALAGLPLEAGIAGRLRELAEFLGGREY
ncbi:MAG TPA: polyprenyl synthetase family protein, partial [Dehalococcoidia bacterium]|nr:polyprenyl synthetase family protein [Dehalococcoidia bacterium]